MPNSFGGSGLVDWYGLAPTSGLSWNGGLQFYGGALALNLNFTTGTLDSRITFSRGTNATLTDSTGKITYAPANWLTYSGDFTNAAWTKNTVTATTNTLTVDTTGGNRSASQSFTAIGAVTMASMSLLAGTATRTAIGIYQGTSFLDATLVVVSGPGVAVKNPSDGRFSISNLSATVPTVVALKTVSPLSLAASVRLYLYPGAEEYSGGQTAGDSVIYNSIQVQPVTYQTTPSTYVATTSSAYYGPRFDYDPITLACKGLLIEEQRTNLLTYSNDYSNWNLANVTLTPNAITSPDGTVNSTKLVETATTSVHGIWNATTFSAVSYTASVYAKAAERSNLSLGFSNTAFPSGNNATFNLANQSVSTSNATATITSVGGGWYRCSITVTAAAGFGVFEIRIDQRNAYAGVVGNGIYIWGAQLEAGAFATSYIPTTSATVARSADTASMTGTDFSSWYNQTSGTFIASYDLVGWVSSLNATVLSALTDNNNANVMFGVLPGFTGPGMYIVNGGVNQGTVSTSTSISNVSRKQSMAYQTNNAALSVDAGAIQAITSCTIPVANKLQIGHRQTGVHLNGHIASIQYYNKRLPNALLQAYTA